MRIMQKVVWGQRRTGRPKDEGIALVGTLGVMLILSAFLLITLAFTLKNLPGTRRDQDAKAAIAAAQAGLDEFVRRVNENPYYLNTVKQLATSKQPDPTNAALKTYKGNGWSAAEWPGVTLERTVDSPLEAKFRYELLSSGTGVGSDVRLRATGRVKDTERSLTANLRPSSFLNYMYYTDMETRAPDLYMVQADVAQSLCKGKRFWEGRPVMCEDLSFSTNDVINGPLHTNDAILLSGNTQFKDPVVESSWPASGNPGAPTNGQLWRNFENSPYTPPQYKPYYAPEMRMRPVSDLGPQAAAQQTAGTGCVYTGATKIQVAGSSMKVWSPNSSTATGTRAACLPATAGGSVPTPEVVFVKPLQKACTVGDGVNSGVGYPLANEHLGATSIDTNGMLFGINFDPMNLFGINKVQGRGSGRYVPPMAYAGSLFGLLPINTVNWPEYVGPLYGCQRANLYVSGQVSTNLTMGAAEDVVVVGNVTRTGDGVVGLVAEQYAWVYHPVSHTPITSLGIWTDPVTSVTELLSSAQRVTKIQAAILSLNGSFSVQNASLGAALGTLTIEGSIGQRYRGMVGMNDGGTGFKKDYRYDTRFRQAEFAPKYFPKPEGEVIRIAQITDG